MDRNIYNFVFLLRSIPFRLIVSILVFFLTLNFVFSATYTCYNCSNCTATIALASANDVVQLNQSITVNLSASSACIDFQTTDTITFDCLHHRNFLRGNSSGYGIFIPNVRNNIVITNCNVSYFEKGIYIGISNNDIITNNLVEHNDEGIDMYTATNATLRNNTLRNNSVAGMYLFGFDGSVAENNVFRENSRGLYCHGSCDNSIFQDNFVFTSTFAGILIRDSVGTSVLNNYLLDNFYGVQLRSTFSSNILYQGNSVLNSSVYGVYFLDNISNISFAQNTVRGSGTYDVYLQNLSGSLYPHTLTFTFNTFGNSSLIYANYDWNLADATFSNNYYDNYNGTNGPICFLGLNAPCDSNPLVVGGSLNSLTGSVGFSGFGSFWIFFLLIVRYFFW